jgi:ATP-dependent helicase/nuclease subunit B
VLTEASGHWTVPGVAPPFVLTGRADRIEHLPCGGIAILDYKTGSVPDLRNVDTGLAPQLPLEAAMAADGAFGDEVAGLVAELTYWRLTGGTKPGETTSVTADGDLASLVQAARDGLAGLIRAFDDPNRAYLAQPRPDDAPRWNDYAQLARVPEWALAEGGE